MQSPTFAQPAVLFLKRDPAVHCVTNSRVFVFLDCFVVLLHAFCREDASISHGVNGVAIGQRPGCNITQQLSTRPPPPCPLPDWPTLTLSMFPIRPYRPVWDLPETEDGALFMREHQHCFSIAVSKDLPPFGTVVVSGSD